MVKSRDMGRARRDQSVENILAILTICEMDDEVCRCAQNYVSAQHLPMSKSVCRRTGVWARPERRRATAALESAFNECVSRKIASVLDDVCFYYTNCQCTDAMRYIVQLARLPCIVQINSITLVVSQ